MKLIDLALIFVVAGGMAMAAPSPSDKFPIIDLSKVPAEVRQFTSLVDNRFPSPQQRQEHLVMKGIVGEAIRAQNPNAIIYKDAAKETAYNKDVIDVFKSGGSGK